MKKAIVTFAKDKEFEDMLGVTLPTFYNYSVKYSYDLLIPSYQSIKSICDLYCWGYDRPTSWLKVPIIKNALQYYDIVLWLDCDIVITNQSPDVIKFWNSDALQAVTVHRDLYEGFVPNCGVWAVSNKDLKWMDKIWNNNQYINHHWWEQMSVINLMNWVPKSNTQSLSIYGLQTIELPFEFNVHKNDIRFDPEYLSTGYFLHATMWPNRIETMKEWVKNYGAKL